MDLKIPEQWLEFPEDVESTEIIPHRTSSTEDFETDAADLPYEDHDQFEFDRDINIPAAATSAAAAHLDNDEILLIEVLVPMLSSSSYEQRPLQNRHQRNDRRRSSRRSRRSRSRQRRRSERNRRRREEGGPDSELSFHRRSNRLFSRRMHPRSARGNNPTP
uniref:Uncharacterized protein n=1 Tax=Anopheles quadriannulatus TaxID=34691 RepID=A0A182WVY7_ANOQN